MYSDDIIAILRHSANYVCAWLALASWRLLCLFLLLRWAAWWRGGGGGGGGRGRVGEWAGGWVKRRGDFTQVGMLGSRGWCAGEASARIKLMGRLSEGPRTGVGLGGASMAVRCACAGGVRGWSVRAHWWCGWVWGEYALPVFARLCSLARIMSGYVT